MLLFLVRTYTVNGGRPSLFLARTYVMRPPSIRSTNNTRTHVKMPDVLYFFRITLWIIPRRTRQPLDHCVKVPESAISAAFSKSW